MFKWRGSRHQQKYQLLRTISFQSSSNMRAFQIALQLVTVNCLNIKHFYSFSVIMLKIQMVFNRFSCQMQKHIYSNYTEFYSILRVRTYRYIVHHYLICNYKKGNVFYSFYLYSNITCFNIKIMLASFYVSLKACT